MENLFERVPERLVLIEFPSVGRDYLGRKLKTIAATGFSSGSFQDWARYAQLVGVNKDPELRT